MPKRTRAMLRAQRLTTWAGRVLARPKRAKRAARIHRKPNLNVHSFSRYSTAATIECNSTTQTGQFIFKFDDILGHTEFGAMFDQFKITKAVIKLQLITNPDAFLYTNGAVNNQNLSNWFPKLWYIRDYDGGSADSLAQIKERQGVKFIVMRPNKEYSIPVSPMVAVQTYRTTTTTGYAPKKLFLDMANGTDVPHYGLNYVIDSLGQDPDNSQPFKIRYEIKFFFTCKDVR